MAWGSPEWYCNCVLLAVLAGSIRRGFGMMGSITSQHGAHVVEQWQRAKKRERRGKVGFALSPASCQAALLSCGPLTAQFFEQHSWC